MILFKKFFQPLNTFDRLLIILVPLFACVVTRISISSSPFFDLFLKLNIILLGYHHVIATYTRICFSTHDFKKNKFLVVYLPLIVFPLVFIMGKYIGLWTIATLYLYWQWFHYTRQSFGIGRYYSKTKPKEIGNETVNNLAIYLFPLSGILYRSYQSPDLFVQLPVATIPVSYSVFLVVLVVSVFCILWQLFNWVRLLSKGALNINYAMYTMSHHLIFLVGYLLIEDITLGWLCINVWHNAQYLLFVWLSNNWRFKDGYNKTFGFISKVSQIKYIDEYILLCLGVTVVFYGLLNVLTSHLESLTSLPFIAITYMSINFHHYVVDGIIWKKKNNHKINTVVEG